MIGEEDRHDGRRGRRGSLSDIQHHGRLLDQAEDALKIPYAIDGGSEEVKAAYQELIGMRERDLRRPS